MQLKEDVAALQCADVKAGHEAAAHGTLSCKQILFGHMTLRNIVGVVATVASQHVFCALWHTCFPICIESESQFTAKSCSSRL